MIPPALVGKVFLSSPRAATPEGTVLDVDENQPEAEDRLQDASLSKNDLEDWIRSVGDAMKKVGLAGPPTTPKSALNPDQGKSATPTPQAKTPTPVPTPILTPSHRGGTPVEVQRPVFDHKKSPNDHLSPDYTKDFRGWNVHYNEAERQRRDQRQSDLANVRRHPSTRRGTTAQDSKETPVKTGRQTAKPTRGKDWKPSLPNRGVQRRDSGSVLSELGKTPSPPPGYEVDSSKRRNTGKQP